MKVRIAAYGNRKTNVFCWYRVGLYCYLNRLKANSENRKKNGVAARGKQDDVQQPDANAQFIIVFFSA